jgi:hypothetical protein
LNGAWELRFATRGIARNDKDYWAMRFLADVLTSRNKAKIPAGSPISVSVIHERNLLPSYISFKVSVQPNEANGAVGGDPKAWLKDPISTAEFEQTRTKILAEIEQKPMIDKTLDVETFRLVSFKDEMQKLNSVTQSDVQRVAEKLAKQPFVSVSLGSSSENKQ